MCTPTRASYTGSQHYKGQALTGVQGNPYRPTDARFLQGTFAKNEAQRLGFGEDTAAWNRASRQYSVLHPDMKVSIAYGDRLGRSRDSEGRSLYRGQRSIYHGSHRDPMTSFRKSHFEEYMRGISGAADSGGGDSGDTPPEDRAMRGAAAPPPASPAPLPARRTSSSTRPSRRKRTGVSSSVMGSGLEIKKIRSRGTGLRY